MELVDNQKKQRRIFGTNQIYLKSKYFSLSHVIDRNHKQIDSLTTTSKRNWVRNEEENIDLFPEHHRSSPNRNFFLERRSNPQTTTYGVWRYLIGFTNETFRFRNQKVNAKVKGQNLNWSIRRRWSKNLVMIIFNPILSFWLLSRVFLIA